MRVFSRAAVPVAAVAFVLVPAAAQASPSFYAGPVFGIDTGPGGTLLVANVGKGIVNGDTGAVLAPASEFSATGLNDVAPIVGSDDLWAVTGGDVGIEDRSSSIASTRTATRPRSPTCGPSRRSSTRARTSTPIRSTSRTSAAARRWWSTREETRF